MNVISYIRVSTRKQGESGLGLEAQRAAVDMYVRQTGAKALANYKEVESGRDMDRPELVKALAHCRRSKSTLVVAKMDRLSRNAAFLLALRDSKVEFVACDIPNANRLTVGIMALIAEDEVERISTRTKAALAAAKARGTLLGSARPGHWDGREAARLAGLRKARERSAELARRAAVEAYSDLRPMIIKLRQEGQSLREIAHRLTDDGHATRTGKPWNPVQVARVLTVA